MIVTIGYVEKKEKGRETFTALRAAQLRLWSLAFPHILCSRVRGHRGILLNHAAGHFSKVTQYGLIFDVRSPTAEAEHLSFA